MRFLSIILTLKLSLAIATGSARADTPLADAAEKKDFREVRVLLEANVPINAAQADGMTALHWATLHDDLNTVQLLLSKGADPNIANRYRVTPLALACTNGSEGIVDALLKSGADSKAVLHGAETVLMIAARTGKLGPVKALISQGADVNAKERKGQTALMWAAAEGNTEVVDVLLSAGADFQTPLVSGFTPFFFAIREGRSEVVSRLLDAGCKVNDLLVPVRGGKRTSPLLMAIENGHFEVAARLLKAGADPNAQPAGYAALHAISWVRKPIRGDGDPPPMGSGKISSLELVEALVSQGANINSPLKKGESGRGRFTTTGATPFLLASRTGDLPLMRLLIKLKADPAIPNIDKSPPLLAAAGVGALGDGDEAAATEEEAIEAVKFLLDLGAEVNAVDMNGETAMHSAAYQSLPKLVQVLADRGADAKIWNKKNKWGWTPLMIARGHRPGNFRPDPETIKAIEKVMQSAGVDVPPAEKVENRPEY